MKQKSSGVTTGLTEGQIHRAIAAWVRANEAQHPDLLDLFHVPNGGSRNVIEATNLKRMLTRKGVSDLVWPRPAGPWAGLVMELKKPGGRVSIEQAKFLQRKAAQGWACYIVDEIDRGVKILGEYLELLEKRVAA